VGLFFKGPSKMSTQKKTRSLKKIYKGESVEQKCFYGTSLRNAEKNVIIVEGAIAFAENSHLLIWPVHPCLHLITNIL
jgi:hypothetical protein